MRRSGQKGDETEIRGQKGDETYEPLVFSQIARGMAIGNELEYTDEVTLGRSIVNRQVIG